MKTANKSLLSVERLSETGKECDVKSLVKIEMVKEEMELLEDILN